MKRTIARGIFYLLAVVLLAWTASLTYSFTSKVLPNAMWLVPLLAIFLFDAGTVVWMFVFLNYAEGTAQRAVAIVLTAVDFIGLGLISAAEVLLDGQTLAAAPELLGPAAVWAIAGWTVFNVGAVVAFHLLSPEARKSMAIRQEQDAVFDEALDHLKELRLRHGTSLAQSIADGMMIELREGLGQQQPPERLAVTERTREPVRQSANSRPR